ncbi:MAG TPA: hypothetical protein VMZ31_15665 [Phycisphaerae bacterium]|nr:hypothetical protein [Phycisphaerae bacterium]
MSSDAASAAECFREAAELNRQDPYLRGSQLMLPDYGQLVMTGDMHGHQRNFDKLQRYCQLERTAVRHVILHELIHEDLVGLNDTDMSHQLLLAAAAWKLEYPEQVHFLQSNHELAQLNGHEITKAGRSVLRDFDGGLSQTYGGDAQTVSDAIDEFIKSLPAAARTVNRVFLAHSLPDPETFDPSTLAQPLDEQDLSDGGPIGTLVWSRINAAEKFEQLAEMLDVDSFIIGHEPQEDGFRLLHDRVIVLASDHNHGVFLPFDLKKPCTASDLVKQIRKFVAVP